LYKRIEEISKQSQQNIGSHGYEHTKRVIDICKKIGKKMKADMEVLIPAAILHDIGRNHDNHALHSARIAREILEEFNYPKIDEIVHAIEVHSFTSGGKSITIEAQILSDADKLDALGAIGIYRSAQYGVEYLLDIDGFQMHFYEKLFKLKDLMYTDEAKKLAKTRHDFMKTYLIQLEKEIDGLG
jgi:uncharacterized protein